LRVLTGNDLLAPRKLCDSLRKVTEEESVQLIALRAEVEERNFGEQIRREQDLAYEEALAQERERELEEREAIEREQIELEEKKKRREEDSRGEYKRRIESSRRKEKNDLYGNVVICWALLTPG